MLCTIVCNFSFPYLHTIRNFLKGFGSWIQKYHIFVAHDCCCLIVPFEIPEDVVLSVRTCVIDCGWPISYNLFFIMMTYLPVTKHPPVSDSAAEAATAFKMLPFTCIGPFRRSRAHFEDILLNKNILQRDCLLPVQSNMIHSCQCVK